MRSWIPLAIAVGALGRSAHAGGALDELSAGTAPQTATNPGTTWTADKLGGMWDVSDGWQLRLDVTGTHDAGSKPVGMSSFGDSGGNIWLANLSAEYDPSDHWSFRVMAGASPSSTTSTATTVQAVVLGSSSDPNAQLKSTSSSISGAAWIGYETAGDSNAETAAVVSATINDFDSLQEITAVEDRNGQMLTSQQIATFCSTHTCSHELAAATRAQSIQLIQVVVDANLSEQLYKNTDVGLDGNYFIYDQDPTRLGYFTVATVGRTAGFGNGVGIAPLQYTITPDVIHRWGPLMALASGSYGKYVDQEGYNLSANLRVQYKLKLDDVKRLKLWGKLTGSRDVDQSGTASRSGSVALGVQYSW